MDKQAEKAKKLSEHRSNLFTKFVEHLEAFSEATEQGDTAEADNQYAYLCNLYTIAIHKKA